MSGGSWRGGRAPGPRREDSGWRVFGEQDADIALGARLLHLAYGLMMNAEDDTREGQVTEKEDTKVSADEGDVWRGIVDALRKHGVSSELNGSTHSRIILQPAFSWRRRRSCVNTTEVLHLVVDWFADGLLLVDFLPCLHTLSLHADQGQTFEELRPASVRARIPHYGREEDARDWLDVLQRWRG